MVVARALATIVFVASAALFIDAALRLQWQTAVILVVAMIAAGLVIYATDCDA